MADNENPAPKPNFDFIMKEEPKQQQSFKLPTNLPKPVFIGGIVVIVLFLVLIIGSIFGGGSGNTTEIYKLMSDAGIVANTSNDAVLNAVNGDTRTVAVTAKQSMTSQQGQLKSYLTSQGVKYNAKQVRTAPDANTTSQLKNSLLNNTYDKTYLSYLKSGLNAYQSDIQTAYKSAGSKLKVILNDAYNSNAVLLKSQQLQ